MFEWLSDNRATIAAVIVFGLVVTFFASVYLGRKSGARRAKDEVFGDPTLAVDTHVFRVSQRLGLHNEKTPEKCEKVLTSLINKSFLPRAHHWFILHGRYTCKARKPMCEDCTLSKFCPSREG